MNVLERVARLVALAASSNEHEARNAAVEACRLIREHRLTISDGAASAPHANPSPWDWFREVMQTPSPPPATQSPQKPKAKKPPAKKKPIARVFVDVVQEATARAAVEKLRPDLRELARDYSGAATAELARIAEKLGLKTEAAVLRRAAS